MEKMVDESQTRAGRSSFDSGEAKVCEFLCQSTKWTFDNRAKIPIRPVPLRRPFADWSPSLGRTCITGPLP
jgi:hypothetical protein